jgi:mannose-6-phosphate isomerase-like protein (cupin superfamily)
MEKNAKWIVGGILALGMAYSADAPKFRYWSHSDLENAENKLAAKMDSHKFALGVLGDEGNHRYLTVHREATGEAEYHGTEGDVMVIQSGEGTLVYGGKMVNARTTAPNEQRGPSIEGGTEQRIAAGDVIAIPAKMPHQVTLAPGKTINYMVVKITE